MGEVGEIRGLVQWKGMWKEAVDGRSEWKQWMDAVGEISGWEQWVEAVDRSSG